MALVVTGVGFLIHIYSLGYMAHDQGFQRFFAYLNLFIFAMMTLVLGENLLMLFVGWEGVGLCSYLLISFWFNDEANAAAGKKAFVVNRIGDFGFLLGIFLIGVTLLPHLGAGEGVFSFRDLQHHAGAAGAGGHGHRPAALPGRHRQVGPDPALHLAARRHGRPDAGQRPDPRRDHGHRRRLHDRAHELPLRAVARRPWPVVAVVGAATALFAATIALAQNDIKKVLAYSTVSQLGYMMLACGVGAFAVGIFHVMTHAFFKALLFLGAGSVIHAMSNEQDMRVMGGLRKKLPRHLLDLPGRHPGHRRRLPPGRLLLQGRDPLEGLQQRQRTVLWAVGFLAAGLTAFYMMRLVVLTFFGEQPGQRRGAGTTSTSRRRR